MSNSEYFPGNTTDALYASIPGVPQVPAEYGDGEFSEEYKVLYDYVAQVSLASHCQRHFSDLYDFPGSEYEK